MDRLIQLRKLLIDFGNTIGISTEQIANGEHFPKIDIYIAEFPAEPLKSLTLNHAKPLLDHCGIAAEVKISIDSMDLLKLNPATTANDLEQFQLDLKDQPSVTLTVQLKKDELCQQWYGQLPTPPCQMFLFQHRCAEILRDFIKAPTELEPYLWGNSHSKRVILLAEGDELIDGPQLAVISAERFNTWLPTANHALLTLAEIEFIRKTCRDNVRWDREWLKLTTPQSLCVTVMSDERSPVAQALLAHWANSAAFYLADRVRENAEAPLAAFVTVRREVQTLLLRGLTGDPLTFEKVRALGQIAEWAYDERWCFDRIRMVQTVIASSLGSQIQPIEFRKLIDEAPTLWGDLQERWKKFISKEVDRYTASEVELENDVIKAVGEFDTDVAEMIKSLTTSMLGAIGALITSLIASAYKDPFDPRIFATGILILVAYLVVFPGIYGLWHHRSRFLAAKNMFEHRCTRYKRSIGEKRVNEIQSTLVIDASDRFWHWWTATLVALFVVVVLCLCAIYFVPSLFHKNAITTTCSILRPL